MLAPVAAVINSSSPGRFDAYSVTINTQHITQAPHILHSSIDHSRLMDTLPHSFSITGAMLKRCVLPRLSFCKTKVIKPCHSVYLLTIYLLKGPVGNFEESLSQLKGSHQILRIWILLSLHKTDYNALCLRKGASYRSLPCERRHIYVAFCAQF